MNNPIHPKHGVPVPLTLTCTITGKITKYTAPEYIKAKIAEAGSLEKLLATYVSKGAKKAAAPTKAAGRSWKGQSVANAQVNAAKLEFMQAVTAPENQIHNIFKLDDGVECNVYSFRQHSSQLNTQTFDQRKAK